MLVSNCVVVTMQNECIILFSIEKFLGANSLVIKCALVDSYMYVGSWIQHSLSYVGDGLRACV